MRHLFDTGRTNIAYVAPWTSDLIDSGPRYEAYRDCMADAGHESRTIGVERVTFHHIQEVMQRAVADGDLPEALFCMNDEIAIATATVLQNNGVRVGDDVAIVGFDGIEETEYCPVPITTVRQPIEEMCSLTWQYLHAQMEDPASEPQQTILIPQLVVRESTRT
jgi:LacI family transcriptional regulator